MPGTIELVLQLAESITTKNHTDFAVSAWLLGPLLTRELFALSSPPWTALTRWVIPATVAVWAACVTHKLSASNVKKASRAFGVIALTLGALTLLVLAPMFEKVQAVR